MVPEVLRGKLSRIGGQEAGQDGLPVPVGELQFAGGADGAVDGGEQQVLTAGEALMAFGRQDGIQQREQIQAGAISNRAATSAKAATSVSSG